MCAVVRICKWCTGSVSLTTYTICNLIALYTANTYSAKCEITVIGCTHSVAGLTSDLEVASYCPFCSHAVICTNVSLFTKQCKLVLAKGGNILKLGVLVGLSESNGSRLLVVCLMPPVWAVCLIKHRSPSAPAVLQGR